MEIWILILIFPQWQPNEVSESSVRNNAHAMSPRPNSAPIQIQNILHTTNIPLPWSPLGEDRRIVTGLTGLNADFPAHNVRKMQSRPN